ncbi:PREDICTED: uncharacterized protein LOC106100763 isoform X2 [Papilio polytes]|uniref:uncharacterized protein LOC106100763 isoform X2 n=1 Tax=Papilio polytes TaxID=76194 RepID=UPI000676A37D|nr:PREDICTED: uncharacterized protein LOC106100763 isoform X2 [Papilio polytes]
MAKAFDIPKKRKLPKLMACMTKNSLENMRNKALFSLDTLDAKGIRRHKLPLHTCIELELKEAGFFESSDYLQDLIYDNIQILSEDEIGIVVDIRKREDFLEHICAGLQRAERERDRDNKKKECLELLKLALYYSEQGKGILWLAEKFFLAAIAVASHYLLDGGRQKACCKYHYASFLLNKFPGNEDMEEAYEIFSDVRDSAIGKDWPLFENDSEITEALRSAPNSVFVVTVLELHKVLMSKARAIRAEDPAKAERLSRLAERRAKDAGDIPKAAEAVIEIGISQLAMNSLNNALKSFHKAYKIYEANNDINGLCISKMHLAAVRQRLGDHETASKLLTEMGELAMQNGLRRHLGRALHLLGELHLRRERPDLGTQHLEEAFMCFMGYIVQDQIQGAKTQTSILYSDIDTIYKTQKQEVLDEDAEQSRVMMAISAEQAAACTVAKVKIIEWKSSKASWWVDKGHHKYIPCLCPSHHRTPLDVLWMRLNERSTRNVLEDDTKTEQTLNRGVNIEDIRKLRSSFIR